MYFGVLVLCMHMGFVTIIILQAKLLLFFILISILKIVIVSL